MTTYSFVSMDFGGFKKNSPMIFQNDERSPMDFKGRNVCSSPHNENAWRKRPVKSRVCGLKDSMVRQEYDKINSLKGLK